MVVYGLEYVVIRHDCDAEWKNKEQGHHDAVMRNFDCISGMNDGAHSIARYKPVLCQTS